MAFTLPLIGDLADLGLNDFQIGPGNARKIRGYVRTNLGAGDALIDTTNQVTLLGDTPITILSNGTWSVDLLDTSSTDLNVEANTLQYELVVEYTSTGSPAKRVYRSGWFALTEADLELVDDVPMAVFSSLDLDLPSVTPSWRSAFVASMEALRDETAEISGLTDVAGAMMVTDADDASAFRVQQDARLLATIAAETAPLEVNRVRPNTWASIGDSISAKASIALNGSGGYDTDRRSWQHWTNIILGQRLEPVVSFAVSGKTAEQMVTEQLPQVLAMDPLPGYCTLMGGTNSINGGATDVTVIASLKTMIDALVAVNVRPVVGTITPRTGFDATKSKYLVRVNNWLRTYVPTVGGVLVDWFGAISDSAGAPATNVHADGLHPTIVGAVRMARVAAAALATVVPPANRLPMSNLESPNPNLVTNPMMTGTSGTKWDAGITGSVATSWVARSSDGSGTITAVASKVARTDVPGDWQQIAISAGVGVSVYQSIIDTTRWATGDQLYALIEFEADADLSGATAVEAFIQASSPAGQSSSGPKKIGDDTYAGAIAFPASGVIRTPTMTVAAGLTDLRVWFRVTGGTPTFRVGRVAILKAN